MRFCLPRTSTLRGAGLGNELFAWSKAFLASEVLDATILHPAFGLNRREYHRDFGTSRFDWLGQKLLTTSFPVIEFGEDAYRSTGKYDFEEAVAEFAEREGLFKRRNYVFAVSGMWGGFLAIRKSRPFIGAELLKARNAVSNLHATLRDVDPHKLLVAAHIRGGDFTPPTDEADYRGRFNVALPLDWYLATCESLDQALPGRIQFLLLTDASKASVKPFLDRFNPLTTSHLHHTAPSDLLLMGMADSIVCSVSSFSMWGAFLSDAPYFWFAPNLQAHGEYASLWGNEPDEQNGGMTDRNLRALLEHRNDVGRLSRGIPIGVDGMIPRSAVEVLDARLRTRALSRDLIYSGVAPIPVSAREPGTRS
jgi:hypothetical protein